MHAVQLTFDPRPMQSGLKYRGVGRVCKEQDLTTQNGERLSDARGCSRGVSEDQRAVILRSG